MLSRASAALARACAMGLLAAFLTGCFLKYSYGNIIIVPDLGSQINDIFAQMQGGATVAVCLESGFFGPFQCTYLVDGEQVASTVSLISEYGIYGVLLDPVIVEVPQDAISVTATYSNAGSMIPAITHIQSTFEYEPFHAITAEAGTKFIIMDFPDDITATIQTTDPVSGPRFDYALSFAQRRPASDVVGPLPLKVMLTAKVYSSGRLYFAPLLPCVTDFGLVPSITLPITTTPVALESQFGDIIRNNQAQPCNHKVYDYTSTPPLYQLRLPLLMR